MLTNPDKELFKNVSKQNVHDYYKMVAPYILPYLVGRPLALVKCPGGVESSCFYNKNSDGGKIYINNQQELLAQVQQNTIEFHIGGLLTFDLDPDDTLGHDALIRACLDLKKILDTLGLESFIKTSGNKGYHIVVGNPPSADIAGFARKVAELMAAKHPDRYTTNIRKDARKGLIFVDWLRNTKGATCVAPYSLRAKPNAGVSMPISWAKLKSTPPDAVTIHNAGKFLRHSSSWQGMIQPQ